MPDWAIYLMVAAGSAAWAWWRGRNRSKADRLLRWETELHRYASTIFRATEIAGAALGWDGARKLARARERVEGYAKRHGIPLSLAKIDEWAEDWAWQAKADADLQAEIEKVLKHRKAKR